MFDPPKWELKGPSLLVRLLLLLLHQFFFAFASDEQRPVLYVSIWAISYQIDKLLNLVSLVFGGYQTPTTCIRALKALKYARVDVHENRGTQKKGFHHFPVPKVP